MQKPLYAFCAMLSRMKYITRWGLMRSTRQENVSEHVAETAIIAHTLGLLAQNVYANPQVEPNRLAVAALYHDASEILTGDMPTPVKYNNTALQQAYKQLETSSAQQLAALSPAALQPQLLASLTGAGLTEYEQRLLKAADTLSALIKCMEEQQNGNTEFGSARQQQLAKLKDMQLAEVNYFMQHYLPCYEKNLDELTRLP